MANPIWDTLTPQFKNGDRKNGMVWFNGQWIPETTATPIMKPKVYNNNAGVPIEPETINKYKDNSTFMERLTAKDSKGNSALGTIGDALIAIGSKGWSNNGLGDGAKVFNDGMKTIGTNKTQGAAIDKAMAVINDPEATPQAKMAAAQTAKDAGADITNLLGMVSSSATGIKKETGYVTDPITGKTTYVDPNGDLGYQETKAKVDSGIKVEEKKQITDIELASRLAEQKGLSDEQYQLWAKQNPIEFSQDMAKQREAYKLQAANQAASASTKGEQSTVRQATAYELSAAKDVKKAQDKEIPQLEKAEAKFKMVDKLFTDLKAIDPNQLSKTIGGKVSWLWLPEHEKILQQLESVLNDQVLASLPPGSASDADVKLARDAVVNRTLDAASMGAVWDSAKAALQGELDNRRAKLAEAEQILNYGVEEKSTPTTAAPTTTATTTPARTITTDSKGTASTATDGSWPDK